jgi:hypothetical protein
MAYEAYNIQRTSDGKSLRGNGGNPLSFNTNAGWQNSDIATNFRITVDYTRNFKQEYQQLSYYIDQFPQNGEIYRINPIYVQ